MLVPTTTSSWLNLKLTWRRVSSLSDCSSNCCRCTCLSLTHSLTHAGVRLKYTPWFLSAGQPYLTGPHWTGWFLLSGRVGTSSGALGRTWASEADFWKGEAVLHRCCHPAKPRGWKEMRQGLLSVFKKKKKNVLWVPTELKGVIEKIQSKLKR